MKEVDLEKEIEAWIPAHIRGEHEARAAVTEWGEFVARHFYEQGYKQAEKDLALTTKDLIILHSLLYAVKNKKQGAFTFRKLSDKQYEEILEIYKGIQ